MLQAQVLTGFWEIVSSQRMDTLDYEINSLFTHPNEPKDPGVMALEYEFEDMLGDENGGWI